MLDPKVKQEHRQKNIYIYIHKIIIIINQKKEVRADCTVHVRHLHGTWDDLVGLLHESAPVRRPFIQLSFQSKPQTFTTGCYWALYMYRAQGTHLRIILVSFTKNEALGAMTLTLSASICTQRASTFTRTRFCFDRAHLRNF